MRVQESGGGHRDRAVLEHLEDRGVLEHGPHGARSVARLVLREAQDLHAVGEEGVEARIEVELAALHLDEPCDDPRGGAALGPDLALQASDDLGGRQLGDVVEERVLHDPIRSRSTARKGPIA
jgi:hypothetical protein